MDRTITTSLEQDAAIAWKAAKSGVTEQRLVMSFADEALADLVRAFRESESSQVFEAFQKASSSDRAKVKAALGL